MKKEIIKPGSKEFCRRSDMVYGYIEKMTPSESAKKAFFRKPYGLGKEKKEKEK